tara:strand:+ start:3619 stop:4728 length:1110 start_codon:yes stop_codon:yes gene_type:complete
MKIDKEKDVYFMRKALDCANNGLYSTHPNPRVGAVIVKNNKILGTGYHRHTGSDHAEYMAIKKSKNDCANSTLYVTLEPCCHYGKTPPCTNFIIENKIKRVVISSIDPNPLVSGKSVRLLRKHGIKVNIGVLKNESHEINKGFFSRFQNNRPYISAKSGISLDGKIALHNNQSKWITSNLSRENVQIERALSSAILTTSNTILSDNPKLTVRDSSLLRKIKQQPTLVILDSQLRVDEKMNVFKDLERNIIIFTAKNINQIKQSKYKNNVKVITVPSNKGFLDLNQVMEALSNEEINELLVESGSTLTGNLIKESLLDELILYISPKILGHSSKTFSGINSIKKLSQKINFKINDIIEISHDLKLRLSRI